MATTHEMQDEGAWAWPCPYCHTSNALNAAVCESCGAQLRDPLEDDLFTTLATDNAQTVDPEVPRIKESLWSTEALPEEEIAEEVADNPTRMPEPPGVVPGSVQNGHVGAGGAPAGPFSATAPPTAERGHQGTTPVFGEGSAAGSTIPQPATAGDAAVGPFGVAGAASTQPAAEAPMAPAAPAPSSAEHPPAQPTGQHGSGPRPTPDQHGLSIAVESLDPTERNRCDTPIAVCGALLGDQEVVLGIVAGHLLGHSAIVTLTNTRVLVANARRWKPLVDQFLPGPDLMVHLRHDRDVASITFVQGDRLTGVDDITDVAGAVDLAERIRSAAARSNGA